MGERSLRRLLILGANSVVIKRNVHKEAQPGTWLGSLLLRKPSMLVRAALANKMAREDSLALGAVTHVAQIGRLPEFPFPGQTCPAASVTGVPGAVEPFKTATRTWNSAARRSKSPRGQAPTRQFGVSRILVSARLRRWYPLHRHVHLPTNVFRPWERC